MAPYILSHWPGKIGETGLTKHFVYKLILAAASGLLVFNIFNYDESQWWLLAFVIHYVLPGALFAASILWPYLDRNNRPVLRGAGLVVASTLSFYCALWTVGNLSGRGAPDLADCVAASLVGAAIVFISAKFIIPFRLSGTYVSLGLGAAVLGGWLFDFLGVSDEGLMAGFVTWHCLMCTALHFSAMTNRKMVGINTSN